MTPEVTVEKGEEKQDIVPNEEEENGGFIASVKNKLSQKVPQEENFNEVSKINGHHIENMTSRGLAQHFFLDEGNMKYHLMRFCENDRFQKKLKEVFEWLMSADISREKKEGIKEAVEAVDWTIEEPEEEDEGAMYR